MDAREKKTLAPNISLMIDRAWADYADRTVFSHAEPSDPSTWTHVTGAEAHDEVDAVAKGLIARGVKPGDRVGIMSRTRIEWTILDFAIWAAGADSRPDLRHLVGRAGRLDHVGLGDLPTVRRDERTRRAGRQGRQGASRRCATSSASTTAPSPRSSRPEPPCPTRSSSARKSLAKHGDLATIMYTSGTTGRPKGVRLTHFNYVRHVDGHPGAAARGPLPGGREHGAVPHARPLARPPRRGRARRLGRGHRLLPRPDPGAADARVVQADAHPCRPARVREGLQRRRAEVHRRRQGRHLPLGRPPGGRVLPGARHRGGTLQGPDAQVQDRPRARSEQDLRGPRRQRAVGRSAARRRSAPAWATSSGASASPSSRATGSRRPTPRRTSTSRGTRRSAPSARRFPASR